MMMDILKIHCTQPPSPPSWRYRRVLQCLQLGHSLPWQPSSRPKVAVCFLVKSIYQNYSSVAPMVQFNVEAGIALGLVWPTRLTLFGAIGCFGPQFEISHSSGPMPPRRKMLRSSPGTCWKWSWMANSAWDWGDSGDSPPHHRLP
jgi:hypothetical protein